MLHSRTTRKAKKPTCCKHSLRLEALEDRLFLYGGGADLGQLLQTGWDLSVRSLSASAFHQDDLSARAVSPAAHLVAAVTPAMSSSALPLGFSPSQISQAYGFNQITFNNGTVRGDGSGQTIAIVDAYDQPNIASDLAAFDTMYGLAAPPSFTKVNQTGGFSYPAANSTWGLETSLDVEWAHAMAPGAKILLVESNDAYESSMMTAVNYARNQPGVAVVSMSWGGGEWSGESAYDSYFTTPSGRSGVAFVASTGDSGSAGAPSYGSSSPNVLAVGGTSLSLDSLGNYSSETGWSGSGGGISAYESQPSYQRGVVTQSSTMRTVPDVAYDASPTSPFAVYDTLAYSGWLQVAGTSAGAPQWAALLAIADQGRALAGKGALGGSTLSAIYALPASDFHDITSGSNGAYSATVGYDLVTGLGTPHADLVVSALADSTPPTVTSFAPAGGATNVATAAAESITFSEALNASTVSSSTVFLRDASNVVAPTTVAYNSTTHTVTLTPTSSLAISAVYTIVVKGGSAGVKDVAGNPLAADAMSSFTTTATLSTPVSLWTAAAMPSTLDSGDTSSVELGTKFTSDTSGSITGLKFYKSAANTGTHTASLWTAGGQLLATATFTNETASGWQQANFATPVAITAGTTYVVSYHTTSGHYSVNRSYFSSAFTSGSLHVPANGGVYLYGAGGFPTQSFQGSNYWVDVVLDTTPVADTTAPTVTSFAPAGGATNVATYAAESITFSEALNASTVTTSTVFLRDASNVVVPTTVAYNATTHMVTLTPSSALANSAVYTIVVKGGSGGVTDVAGNPLAADVTASFTTISTPVSLWTNSTTPATVDSGDGKAVELGTKFTSDVNGVISGLKFYKSAANTGTHTASLWTASGQLLATATFTNETASGWQQVNFATPVAITAGTTYVVSYHTTSGHYSVNRSYFTSQFTSGSLHVPANGGVYLYGAGGFPTQTYQSSNYWVDVLFSQ